MKNSKKEQKTKDLKFLVGRNFSQTRKVQSISTDFIFTDKVIYPSEHSVRNLVQTWKSGYPFHPPWNFQGSSEYQIPEPVLSPNHRPLNYNARKEQTKNNPSLRIKKSRYILKNSFLFIRSQFFWKKFQLKQRDAETLSHQKIQKLRNR